MMIRNLCLAGGLVMVAAVLTLAAGDRDSGTPEPATIDGFGRVTAFPDAAAQPRHGSKLLVDMTGGGPPDELSSTADKLARFINIYGAAGKEPAGVRITVVLHGDATYLALNDKAWAEKYGAARNPNLPLFRKLRETGVELLVCGQSLTRKGFEPAQTDKSVELAVSGLTALVNYQQDGYAFIPLR
ncbi:MAG: DsrE family protein [Saprospiraceae bacterium]|nr:DsrE family protein [Planctomycetaceae bacterium]MCB0543776.1 DsrE family protein [Saprospiraceae bacterium]